MLPAKFHQSLDDMGLDINGALLRVVAIVRNRMQDKIGIVNRVMDTKSYVNGGTAVDDGSCYTGPHGLYNDY